MPFIRDLHLFLFVFCFFLVVCLGKKNTSVVLKNIFDKQYDKNWQLSIRCISQNVLTAMSILKGLDNNQESEVSQKFIGNLISRS